MSRRIRKMGSKDQLSEEEMMRKTAKNGVIN
jgi:hypothetical protein